MPLDRPAEESARALPGQNSDYFARDPATLGVIEEVERYHLSEDNFWRNYRDGHLEYASNDLIFTLRWLPNHPRALYLMESICAQMGRAEDAIPYYEKAVTRFPQHAYTRAQYGAFLIRLGAREVGIQELRTAIAADSTLVQARAWLQEALIRRAPPGGDALPRGSGGGARTGRGNRPGTP